MKLTGLAIAMFFSSLVVAQSAEKLIQQGNEFYRAGMFEKAAVEYSAALRIKANDNRAKLNLANALQKQNRTIAAMLRYDEVAKWEPDNLLNGNASYNKAVILGKEKKIEESIEAYKNALRKNPNDKEARENLQKALLELKKKNPPKKKEEKKEKKPAKKQPQMNSKEAAQRLKLLEQKEKELQKEMQKRKSGSTGAQGNDW